MSSWKSHSSLHCPTSKKCYVMSQEREEIPTLDLPTPAIWVPGRKAGSMLLVDPHQVKLRLKSKDATYSYYWCSRTEGENRCPVRVTLDRERDLIVKHTGVHNHDSALVKEAVMAKYKEAIDNAVANPTVAPRTAFQDLTASVMSEPSTSGVGIPELPNPRSVARQIQRKRKENLGMPPLPRTWDEMVMPEGFYQTSDGKDFCVLESVVPGSQKKVWGWASETGINILCAASDVYADGTFEIVGQTLFAQLWVIIAKCDRMEVTIPCAFFLLPDKSYATYLLCLRKLRELGVQSPARFHLDFEMAAIKAVRVVFGVTTSLECCDTHWKRALRSNQQKQGLVPNINNVSVVQSFMRRLWALSFVPIADIVKVYDQDILPTMPVWEAPEDEEADDVGEESVHNYNRALDNYLHYFEATWVGAKDRRTGVRGGPMFAHALWSKYLAVKDERPDLTSNRSEAYNSASKMSIPMKPTLWVVCKFIQREEGQARAKVQAAIGAHPPTDPHPARTRKRLEKAQALKRIVDQYDVLPKAQYLDALVAHFNTDL